MTTNATEMLSGFRRHLIQRMAGAGVLVALLTGLSAFYIETERLDDALVDRAGLQAQPLSALVAETGKQPDNDAALAGLLKEQARLNRDFFVVAEAYDTRRQSVGEASLPSYETVGSYFDKQHHKFPKKGGDSWYSKTVIDGTVYFRVMVPLLRDDGHIQGWFEGVYRLSQETVASIRADIAWIVGLATAAVLLTAAVLFPLISSLQGHILRTARDLLRANIDTLKVLGSAIAKRDNDTNAHNFRVTLYAVRIAEALGLGPALIRSLIKGAFLHDVGKIAIPDQILLKPGKLDEAEFEQMKTHVLHGLDIIAASDWLADARDVVAGHHEKVDSSGYPHGLSGETIPLSARIFAVADVFDALTSERPYKKALPVEKALEILEQGRERHFDGQVLDAFRAIMPAPYDEVAGRDDQGSEAIMDALIGKYFGI